MRTWETQKTFPQDRGRPEDRARLTNAAIQRSVVLACYENMAWMAVYEWHTEQAAYAARMALRTLSCALDSGAP